MYQRLTETCPRQEAIRHDVEQLMNALRQLFLLVSVRHWYITRKVCSYCSNLLDRKSAWSPSSNSKHALLWLNKDKIVSKIPSRWEEIHSHGHVEFQSRYFLTARALLTGSSPGLLDLWKYQLDIYFFIPSTKLWRQGKKCIPYKYKKLDIKARSLINKYVLGRLNKLATDNNVISLT